MSTKTVLNPYVAHLHQLLETARERYERRGDNEEPVARETETSDTEGRTIRDSVIRQIEETHTLPTLPDVITELQRVLSDPRSNAQKVADVLELDPVLAARVLRLANSAMYGAQREIADLGRAVALLGLREIWTLALTASVHQVFSTERTTQFDPRRFWEHSLTVAMGCRLIAKSISEKGVEIDAQDAFLAGLLHDIGEIFVAEFFADAYKETWHLSKQAGVSFSEAELSVLGVHHGDIGHRLLSHWNIPEEIGLAIRFHHDPGSHGLPSYVVHLADEISRGLGFVADVAGGSRLDPAVWTVLDLSDDVVEKIAYSILVDFESARAVLFGSSKQEQVDGKCLRTHNQAAYDQLPRILVCRFCCRPMPKDREDYVVINPAQPEEKWAFSHSRCLEKHVDAPEETATV